MEDKREGFLKRNEMPRYECTSKDYFNRKILILLKSSFVKFSYLTENERFSSAMWENDKQEEFNTNCKLSVFAILLQSTIQMQKLSLYSFIELENCKL